LARLPPKLRNQIEKFVFQEAPKLKSISEVKKIEQMRGYSSFFKMRFGDYRVGLRKEVDQIVFERVLHRKEIYRYFP
jgi:mRNA interferase RelE/StbE